MVQYSIRSNTCRGHIKLGAANLHRFDVLTVSGVTMSFKHVRTDSFGHVSYSPQQRSRVNL